MRMSISTTSGLQPARELDRLGAVGGLADDVEVVLGVEDHAEAGAHERLVVGDQHARHALDPLTLRQREARADAKAAAGRGPASSSPP